MCIVVTSVDVGSDLAIEYLVFNSAHFDVWIQSRLGMNLAHSRDLVRLVINFDGPNGPSCGLEAEVEIRHHRPFWAVFSINDASKVTSRPTPSHAPSHFPCTPPQPHKRPSAAHILAPS